MNRKDLIETLEKEIATKQQEIIDARDIIKRLKIDNLADDNSNNNPNINLIAIGESPRMSIVALCQSRGMGMPVDFKQLVDLPEGCTWGKGFSSDGNKYSAFGVEVPGGIGLVEFKQDTLPETEPQSYDL